MGLATILIRTKKAGQQSFENAHGTFDIMHPKDVFESVLQTEPGSCDISEGDLTNDDILQTLGMLKEHWTRPLTGVHAAQEAAERFGLLDKYTSNTLMPVGEGELDMTFKKVMFALTRLEMQMYMRHIVDVKHGTMADDVAGEDLKAELTRIYFSVTQLHRSLKSDLLARKALDPSWAIQCPFVKDELMCLDPSKMSDFQVFLLFVMEKLREHGYARFQDQCYEEVLSPPVDDGEGRLRRYSTRAWKPAKSIDEFVNTVAPLETSFEMWQLLTTTGFADRCIKHLKTVHERGFPILVPDRHWHSFRNGIYFTRKGQFFLYGSKDIPPDVVACNYHDIDFDVSMLQAHDWTQIPTPSLQRILEYQLSSYEEKDKIIDWVYVFIGRLLFELNDLDKWQVILFCYGKAGTGKSKLLDAITGFFNSADVGVLSNSSQKDFGLETFVGKLIWTCYEVKHDFTLDQANFQSMVTGEKVVIQRKGKPALSVLWTTPGILAGNEVPNWSDNSGSIARRILVMKFDKKVLSERVDPNLDKKIKREIGNILHKTCCAYMAAATAYGDSDIWKRKINRDGTVDSILPKFFHDQRSRLVENTHPLANFIKNSNLSLVEPTVGMPFHRFQDLANQYFLQNNYPKFMWGKTDKYASQLDDHNIVLKKLDAKFFKARGNDPMEYNGMEYRAGTEWLFGITEFSDETIEVPEEEPFRNTSLPGASHGDVLDTLVDEVAEAAAQVQVPRSNPNIMDETPF